jgi:predicted nucleic acid-binding protein
VSGFLLDTNVISELIRPRPHLAVVRWVEATDENLLHLSVLTIGEICKGIASVPGAARRTHLAAWLETELRPRFAGRLLPVTNAVAVRWGLLAGQASASGSPLPVIDGLLAATALHHHLTLVTRNTKDVPRTGVPVLSPWETRPGR